MVFVGEKVDSTVSGRAGRVAGLLYGDGDVMDHVISDSRERLSSCCLRYDNGCGDV